MREAFIIEKIPYLGYCFAFLEHRTAYSDYFAKEAAESGTLLCAKSDGHFIGYICATRTERELRVTHAYTVPTYRKMGVFTALLSELSDNSKITVRVVLPEDQEFHDTIADICKQHGFVQGESVIIYTYRPSEDTVWSRYMEAEGNRKCDALRSMGYNTFSFADADDNILRQIKDSDTSDFGNPFETRSFFDDPTKNLSYELSFVTVKDSELVAFTLASLPAPKKGVLEQIVVSKKDRGKGIILLPFSETMKHFREAGGEIATYAIYGSNARANAFRDKIANIATRKISENYYRYFEL